MKTVRIDNFNKLRHYTGGNRSRGGTKNALYEIPRKQHEKRYRFDFFRSFKIRKISISGCKSFSSQFKNHSLICQVA
jgi:hypothetical protein